MRALSNATPYVKCEGGRCPNLTRGDRTIHQPDGTYKVLCDQCLAERLQLVPGRHALPLPIRQPDGTYKVLCDQCLAGRAARSGWYLTGMHGDQCEWSTCTCECHGDTSRHITK